MDHETFQQEVDAAVARCPQPNMRNPTYFAGMLAECVACTTELEAIAQEEIIAALTRIADRQRAWLDEYGRQQLAEYNASL